MIRPTLVLLSFALVSPVLPMGAAEQDFTATNQSAIAALYDDLLATDGHDGQIDWSDPAAAAFLARASDSLGRVDIGALLDAADGGGAEAGGFPLVGDALLIEAAIKVNSEIKCSAEPVHYHTAAPVDNLTFDYVGVATSTFSNEGLSFGLGLQLPAGFWSGTPGPAPLPKFFVYKDEVLYGGNSDFACDDFKYCAFGICYYFVWNAPKIIGAVDEQGCDVVCQAL